MSNNPNKEPWLKRISKRLGWEGSGSGQSSGALSGQVTTHPVEGVKRFKSFVLVPLPESPPDQYASEAARDGYADSIVKAIVGALRQHNLMTFDLLEIYTTPSSKGIIKQLFHSPTGSQDFERLVQGAQWSARQQQSNASGPLSSRVYLVPQMLEFAPVFEDLLSNTLLVRPLGSGSVPVPKEPTQDYREVAQILLGEVIIYDNKTNEVGREELWAWRAVQREDYFTVHVDFDLLHRAVPANLRPFPLGLEISCSMDVSPAGKRRIEEIVLNIKEAKEWLMQIRDKQVNYYLDTGNRHYRENPLALLPDDKSIPFNDKPTPRSLGRDRTGQPIETNINRDVAIVAERGAVAFHYLFNFFEKGANFTPKNNSLRVSGQLIRDSGITMVWLPPTFEKQAEEFFTVSVKAGGGFEVRALTQPLSVSSHGTLQPGQTCVVSSGDEIRPGPSPIGGVAPDDVTYSLRLLHGIPAEVLQNQNYSAFLEVQGKESSNLVAQEHIIGSGVFFARNTPGIGSRALIFRRNWTRVIMEAGANQEVWFGRDVPGVMTVDMLTQPVTLELNDYYRIYVGDFQLRLDLASTPQSD